MWKFGICIFAIGAFLTGVESEVACIFEKVKDVGTYNFFIDPDLFCRNVDYRLARAREGLKKCTHHKICIDRYEYVVNDFCTPGSNFRQTFLRGVESEVACIFDKVQDVGIFNFFMFPDQLCRNVDNRFARAREGLKRCTHHKISIDSYECVVNDFCTPGSNFRQGFEKSNECLAEKLDSISNCLLGMISEMKTGFHNEEIKNNGSEAKEICTRSFYRMVDCIQNKAQPCGDEAMKVFKRMVEPLKSLMVGACLDTADVDADIVEMETAEEGCIIEETDSGADFSFFWLMFSTMI